eukprot:Em0013g266a
MKSTLGVRSYDAIVVGGGHNGLVAAAYLAKAGKRVAVLERRHVLGGAAVTEEIIPGYKFSRASYALSLLRPQIANDLELKKHGLKVYHRDYSSFTPIRGSQRSLILGTDEFQNSRQIAQFSPKDAQVYLQYKEWMDRMSKSIEPLLDSAPINLHKLTSGSLQTRLSALKPLVSLATAGVGAMLDTIAGSKLFTTLDLESGYLQVESRELSQTQKTQAVKNFPTPTNATMVKQFLGLSNDSMFIQNYAFMAEPLYKLTWKATGFQWSEICQDAIDTLKNKLITAPVLAYQEFEKPFLLYTDASNSAIGWILGQKHADGEEVIAYWSWQLHKAERQYSTVEKEAHAAVSAVKEFHPYLDGFPFTLITDHNPLVSLKGLKDIGGRLSRWIMFLQQFNMEFRYKPGQERANADCLSRYVLLHLTMGGYDGGKTWCYVEGGMGSVSMAIAKAAQLHGAELYTEKKLCFDIPVALRGLPNFIASPNTPGDPRPGPHHQCIAFLNCESIETIHQAYLDCQQGEASSRPYIEMCMPSSLDPTLAPEGCHVLSLFTQYTPYQPASGPWNDENKEKYCQKVFDCIEEYAPGFKQLVVGKEVLTPPDLERIFGLTGGNAFHGSMSLDQLYMFRPIPLNPGHATPIKGLYLCGSGTHPAALTILMIDDPFDLRNFCRAVE